MKNYQWFHCHLHSSYSLLDGLCDINKLVKQSKIMGFKYVSITDHASVSGLIKLQHACEKSDIVPIAGVEFYIVDDHLKHDSKEHRRHVTAWVQNETGWNNVLKMLTVANLEGFYRKPRISYDLLFDHADGLVLGSACVDSFLHDQSGIEFLEDYLREYQRDVYLELMPHNTDKQKDTNRFFLDLSKKYDLPLVVSNDSHWIEPEDAEAQAILLAIQTHKKWNDPDRWKFGDEYKCHVKSADEVISDFETQGVIDRPTVLEAMRNTVEIAEICKYFRIQSKPISLPYAPGTEGKDESLLLEQLVLNGYYDKICFLLKPEYEERIEEELSIIKKMGNEFVRYFLIVHDIIKWCNENGIMSGSRGSCGCSIVAYCLGITLIDPVKYNLPFSRFINEERVDLVDIDLDIDREKRETVINYIKETYGEHNVAGISTFGKMKAKQVIRDVGSVFEIDGKELNTTSKMIREDPHSPPDKTTLAWFLENDGKDFYEKYKQVCDNALRIENTTKSLGQHAAGIIIADHDLRNGSRCCLDVRKKGLAINWGKEDAEYCGLMKMDVLGLATFAVLSETKRLIKENHGVDLSYQNITLDDKNIFDDISNGNTTGIFQMGPSVAPLAKEAGISNILEWSDVVALARPGPKDSGLLQLYIERKKGAEWERKHPLYEEATKDTFGLPIYQENIISIFNKVAGLPYSTADQIRRIIGRKRDPSEFEPYKKRFVRGCLAMQSLSEKEAEDFWEDLHNYARYVFNLPHALSYAIIGYWTCYVRYYYPSEFICASLTYDEKTEKDAFLREAQRIGLEIIPPKIGISDSSKWVSNGKKLYVPFIEIKSIGEKMAHEISQGGRLKKTKKRKKDEFFSQHEETKSLEFTPATKRILEEIKAFDINAKLPKEAVSHFDFSITGELADRYPTLANMVFNGSNPDSKILQQAINGELQLDLCQNQAPFVAPREFFRCKRCSLRDKDKPVPCSPSDQNMMIVAECPSYKESEQGKPLVGPAGYVLWSEMQQYELYRDDFHVTNVTKCYNRACKNPTLEHIEVCKKWLEEEIDFVKPKIILVLGNKSLYFFTGEESGIMKRNATIEWSEKYQSYLCYCCHPSSTLRSPAKRSDFNRGIQFFSEKLKIVAGI